MTTQSRFATRTTQLLTAVALMLGLGACAAQVEDDEAAAQYAALTEEVPTPIGEEAPGSGEERGEEGTAEGSEEDPSPAPADPAEGGEEGTDAPAP